MDIVKDKNFIRIKIKFFFASLLPKKVRVYFYPDLWCVSKGEVMLREQGILNSIIQGRGLDVGCGSYKMSPFSFGVDLNAKGREGSQDERGKISQAEMKTDMNNLFMFKSNSLDYIVSRMSLEHSDNPKKTLKEWKRVLKIGGRIGVIVPDKRYIDSDELSYEHGSNFDLEDLIALFCSLKLKIIKLGEAIPKWSIYLIAQK